MGKYACPIHHIELIFEGNWIGSGWTYDELSNPTPAFAMVWKCKECENNI